MDNKSNIVLEKLNGTEFLSDEVLDSLDFYELCLYFEFLNKLEKLESTTW